MRKNISESQKNSIQEEFCKYVGNVIRNRRIRKNISQEELGEFVGKSKTSINQYESAKKNMKLPTLGLICYYCDLPFYQLFPRTESDILLNTFDEIVHIAMEPPRAKKKSNGTIVGKIVDYDGHEVYEPVIQKDSLKLSGGNSYHNIFQERDDLKHKIISFDELPFTKETIKEFLFDHSDLYDLLFAALIILQGTSRKKAKALRRHLAKFVIDEFLSSDKSMIQQLRLKEYYLASVEENYLKHF